MNLRNDFISSLGLKLSAEQFAALELYADLVWQKKDQLNLTSVRDKQEIWDRHICDGLAAAAYIKNTSGGKFSFADYGAGAGYIGISVAIASDLCGVTLVESLNKRCLFLDWVILKLGLKNVNVSNTRAGEVKQNEVFDFTSERAMGKLDEVLPLCAVELKRGGKFIAYQAEDGIYDSSVAQKAGLSQEKVLKYKLPCDDKTRKLVIFNKYGYNQEN